MSDYPPEVWAGRERIVLCLRACEGLTDDQLKLLIDHANDQKNLRGKDPQG